MLTSAPFDDWWHNAYGLDVKIISPPHMVLAAGIAAIQCGAMLMALAWQNRAVGERKQLGRLYLVGAGLLVLLVATVATEYIQRWDMHQSLFYQVSAGVFVFLLVSTARASIARWPATITALVYAGLDDGHAARAAAVSGAAAARADLRAGRSLHAARLPAAARRPGAGDRPGHATSTAGRARDWGLAALIALLFVATFVAAQWPFADFLMSPWARNDFFGSHRMDYGVPPEIQERWYRINPPDNLAIGPADRGRTRLRVGAPRPVVGQLDGASPAMRVCWLIVLAALSMAHVGSPDTFFTGKAGPYDVRVSVRLPGVIPGRAQVAVRVVGATLPANPQVSLQAGQWNVGLKGAPPPEPAVAVPGDPQLYAAELWFMTASSYQLAVDVTGAAGSGTAIVPVMALATAERPMPPWLGGVLAGLGLFLTVGF